MRRVKPRAIRAFKNGDKDAFEEIFYAYKDILYYLCYFYIRDYDDASDCVQEIFIKLTSKISLYDERKAAFEACIEKGIKDVVITTWGGDTVQETSLWSTMPRSTISTLFSPIREIRSA